MKQPLIAFSFAAATAFLLPIDATFAQKASVTYYGKACQHYVSAFKIIGLPQLGKTVSIQTVSGAYGAGWSSNVQIMLGVSNTSAGGLRLPLDASYFNVGMSVFCGWLLQSVDLRIPVPTFKNTPKTVWIPFQVPNDASLVGVTVYAQVLRRARGDVSFWTRYDLSEAARLVVGL